MDPVLLLAAIAQRVAITRLKGAMATVTVTSGSVPQKTGARIALFSDGSVLGTVGGGAIEQEVLELLNDSLKAGTFRCHERHLTKELGMCCGGKMTFFLEPLHPTPRLILFGAGHISQPCAQIAAMAGFQIVVIDEREELNTQLRFPNCERIVDDGVDVLRKDKLRLDDNDFVVICTHSHRLDELILGHCASQSVHYLGMIGSQRKANVVRQRVLQKQPLLNLDHLHCPMGLGLGAVAPSEIAVSIVAELIQSRRQKLPPKSTSTYREKASLGIVLAAGASTRMGFPKALGTIGEKTVLSSIVETLEKGGCEKVYVVVASPHGPAIKKRHPDYFYVENPSPENGMCSSLRAGLSAALNHEATHLVVALLDQPGIAPQTIKKLLSSAHQHDADYLVPSMEGRRGHPFVLRTSVDLSSSDAKASLRSILKRYDPPLEVPIEDEGILDDLDTPADALRQNVLPATSP